ncbi:DUF1206 domain-containing protein [Ponticoccus sp. (in: a-proteobacteria)]|uniref:DUF1206 domain-containing protein n=1 Tax=Ponticoccus sp. (in: a-proteobacteria) TaxID=1925025 RepID=UPI003AB32A10
MAGGQAQGTTDALADLKGQTWGLIALWAIGLGLIAYALWRVIAAWMDLECRGTDAEGLFARAGLLVTGAIHAGLGVSVLTTALRGGGGEGGAIGLGTIGAGGYYVYKGHAETYKDHIRVTPTTRRLDPAMKAGCVAQGVVIAVIGALILYAALTADPGEAGGVGEALHMIRSQPFGRLLLGAIGLGLIGFAIENLVEALYRVVPAHSGEDVMTFARRARLKAEGKLAEATA